ncbi:AraC family ligand binding domain-containing protein (plasmid) [Sphingomonas zeae]
MIRCIRIWTNDTGNSSFEEGSLSLGHGKPGDLIGATIAASSVSFRETQPDQALEWHDAPTYQLVLTLGGTLEFKTRDGGTFVIRPGDVLLAEDTKGTGHVWRIIGEEPWRRAYVILPQGADVGFTAKR